MNAKLRIGVIGAGANTRAKHIPGFRALPDVEVTAVVNRTGESSLRAARELGIPRVAAGWRELVEAPDIDAVCIGTWPYRHAEITCAALAAGKHVLTEARMASDATEAGAMVAALTAARVRNSGVVAQIVPSPFTFPYDRTVMELLAADALGELQAVTVAHTHGGLADPRSPITWRQRREFSGLNTLTLGIYYEALLRWLGWEATVTSASAETLTTARPDATGHLVPVDVPDRVQVSGTYPNGATLELEFSGIETRQPRNEIVLQGSQATLRLDLAADALWLQPAGGSAVRVAIDPAKRGGWQVEADFVASICTGAPVTLTDFATGLRYMRFTEAAWRAWNGRPAV